MPFELPALPFAPDSLAPHMSAETLSFHHGKHHQAYITNLNNLIKDTPLATQSLEAIIKATADDAAKVGIFNNAAQVWNHSFFWTCLRPGGGAPEGAMKARIDAAFGSYDAFKDQFKQAAVGQFGSGWAWLVETPAGKLEIKKTGNAMTPIVTGDKPLLTCDVWEHAYYLDYQNRRPDFVDAFLNHLAAWPVA